MTFVRLFEDSDTPDWPYAWPRPRGLEDAPARIGWLRRQYMDYARVTATRIHYGVEPPEAYDAEIVVPAVCLAQRLGWPSGLAVTAMDAERRRAEEHADRHDQALRRALWPLIKVRKSGDVLLRAAQRVDRACGDCFSTDELIEIVRGIARVAQPFERRSAHGR